ncbi:DUF455 family protein [Luteibacter sp. Lutesp34]|uniref:DUF455 family protein n=1 Tax=Luteibacter sp. Lutesp34 TaxID=3243030 RepID=UPI0039B4BF8E
MSNRMPPLVSAISDSGALCYALLRIVEFHAAWLPRAASTELKIELGYRIGKLGSALASAHLRFTELTTDVRLLAPICLEHGIVEVLHAETDETIAAASNLLLTLVGSFVRALIAGRNRDPLFEVLDGPGATLLAGLAAQFPASAAPWPTPSHGTTVLYGNALPIPQAASSPSRAWELEPRRGDEPSWAALIGTPGGRAQILYDIFADIELSAMEVCAASLVRFRELPVQFKIDMARQCWDEARHASACLIRSEELGGPSIGRRYSLKVWDRWAAGRDVIECLCIEQLVQEGNALDSVESLASSFRATGDARSADLLKVFGRDEELHTAIGNKWVNAIAGMGPDLSFGQRLRNAAQRIGLTVPGHAPVAFEARRRGGFPESFLQELASVNRSA